MKRPNSVVLFLIDSLRPDGLKQADTPHLDRMISDGAHTFSAQTVVPSKTLTCHTSLFFSVEPDVHGVTTNTWQPLNHPISGLFEVIFEAGLNSITFFNWEQLRDLHQPGSVQAAFYLKDDKSPENDSDQGLAALAVDHFTKHRVDFAFIFFHQTDAAGHRDGWMSEPYLRAIANADRCIGKILKVLPEETVVMITADHGGLDHSHGADSPEETTIPFIVKGPGIPSGYRIERPVRITDIAPTITSFLAVETPSEWIGKAVTFSS